MTREEAISQLQDLRSHCKDFSEEDSVWQKDIEALEKAIKALQEQDWIPCSESLPERFENVLVTAKLKGDVEKLVYEGCYRGHMGWELDGVRSPQLYNIMAWQPLPEPWEGVEE